MLQPETRSKSHGFRDDAVVVVDDVVGAGVVVVVVVVLLVVDGKETVDNFQTGLLVDWLISGMFGMNAGPGGTMILGCSI